MYRFLFILGVTFASLTAQAQEAFDDCLNDLGKSLALRMTLLEKSHVAVSDLVTLEGDSSLLGMAASEELTVALVHHALSFDVMDRAHLRAIFAEHRLALGGLMNDSTLIQLGKLESVDVIITGTISQLSDRYKITVKALDTETASLLAAERAYCKRTEELDRAFFNGTLPPDIIRTPPPPPVDLTDCEAARTGGFKLENYTGKTLQVELIAEACGTRQTHTLAPGEAVSLNGVCAGLVRWSARQGTWRKAGSVYVFPCSRKKITLQP